MESKFSFVCAYANVSSAGNLNAAEIFSSIGAPQFPCIHPSLMFVARVHFSENEMGSHKFRLLFMGENGLEVVQPVSGEIQVREHQPYINLILNFAGVSFPKPGIYWLDLSIDGKHVTTDEIEIVQVYKA